MTTLTDLANAHPLIGKHWSENPPADELRILAFARDALDFVFQAGQRYSFEDFFNQPQHQSPPSGGGPMDLRELLGRTRRYFEQLRDVPGSLEEANQSQAILDAIRFIESTGRIEEFGVFREHVDADAPPFVVASFESKEDADAWLARHPMPPYVANVLVANGYHTVAYDREKDFRRLLPNRALQGYLEDLKERERPEPVATFGSLDEATHWWQAQPESVRRAWLRVGGEIYLAAYYPNIHHRALFPLSMAHDTKR